MNRSARNGTWSAAVCAFLLLAVALVFGRTVRYDFVNFDDDVYVYDNPDLAHGLSGPSIARVLTATECYNWHPLTLLSYLADYQLYGLKPGGYHLTNVLLHAATAVGLFLVFRRMTGDVWPSAFVAAVFAIHPLRVESVAWVSERKDVLSGLIFMLTLGAYVAYVRRPFSLLRYLLVVLSFALGLMAKPMLVTLPLVLLLLDYWPLGRMALGWRLLVEKLPLLALSAASCVATSLAQKSAIAPLDFLPLGARVANALISYVAYLGHLFYPANLAVFYPYPSEPLAIGPIAVAVLILGGICGAVVFWRRRCPWLLVGWCWYLGMLVPVIGLVQVGRQAMADRYTYLPQIGLLIAVAWGAKYALRTWPRRAWTVSVAAVLIVATLMGCAWRQTSYWRNGETLWRHALDCTSGESVAGNNLGTLLRDQGRLDEAVACLRDAQQAKPTDVMVLNNLALALNDRGKHAEALALLDEAVQLQPDELHTQRNLGVVLAASGRFDEALERFRKALDIKPDDAETHDDLGIALTACGRVDEAIDHLQKALDVRPDMADAHYNLGVALIHKKQFDEAIPAFGKALAAKPDMVDAHNNLGVALAGRGRFEEAIVHYRRAVALKPDAAEPHNNLGTALARLGRLDEAIAQFQKALELKPDYPEARRSLDFVRRQRDGAEKSPASLPKAMQP